MSNFLLASRLKLRFNTSKGTLTAEQLWDLSLTELDSLAVELQQAYEDSKGKSFLTKRSRKDKTIKLQFDIVLTILNTLVEEQDMARNEAENKAHNTKILQLIQKKREVELEKMSEEELQSLLK